MHFYLSHCVCFHLAAPPSFLTGRINGAISQGPQTSGESDCLFEIERNVWGNIKESYIVNFYRGMAKLKLKIIVNLLQLLCIVVSVTLKGEFERFGGFCVDCYHTLYCQRKTHQIAQIRHLEPQKRQYTTTEVGLHLF